MTDKTISNTKKVDSDYFRLNHLRTSNKKLDYYLKQFNIEDYWIYKSARKQYKVTIQDLYDFNYSSYIFFKKDKYDYKEIDESLKLIWEKLTFMYLDKPLPPLEIIDKIKIKE
jgi:Uma2 family endonuclease